MLTANTLVSTTIDNSAAYQHLITDDASTHEQAQAWLTVEYSQIDAGEFNGRIIRRELGPVTAFLEYQNKAVHKRAHVPEHHCTVSMIDQGHDAARFMRHSMEQDDLLFLMPANTDCDLVIPGGISSCYAVMDQRDLFAGIRALNADGWEHDIPGLQAYKSNSSRQLLEQLSRIALGQNNRTAKINNSGTQSGRQLLHQLALIIHEATLAGVTADGGLQLRQRRLDVVRKTRDYILSCLDQHYSPSVVDICNNVGVGARVLQYSFNDYLQITPVAYLRILRLNKVRQQLVMPAHPELMITDIATRFGFMHLSNFARDYCALFGELPSVTLQRALR